jgi:solute:Na+ symporter, SSS family
MHALDFLIVGLYMLAALGVGLALARRASSGSDEFFLAGRSLPWWVAGTSMVATTFAADTPLAVTGLVAAGGIAGNWVWWAVGIAHVVAAVLFARYWRRLEVVTDAEVLELRYSGGEATVLRTIKAFYQAVFINCLTMGWVILAMTKVCGVLFPEVDPKLLTFSLMGLAVVYSLLGGMRSVVITDLAQFSLAMVGAVLLMVFVLRDIGGVEGLVSGIHETYPDKGAALLAFWPEQDLPTFTLSFFAALLFVGWWKQGDGGGYLVQRMAACKTAEDAEKASVWFAVLHNAIRPWPWIVVGLAALVVWPLAQHPDLDREATYAMLLVDKLPTGLLGLMVASMLAAFMSTIDTHVNWGASYMVTDLWKRFGGGGNDVLVGRVSVVVLGLLAATLSLFMTSIAEVWIFIITLGSGLGSVQMARWLWWRVGAEEELAALLVSTLLALWLVFDPSFSRTQGLLIVALGSLSVWVPMALFHRPSRNVTVDQFYRAARPPGFWGPVAARNPDVDVAVGSGLLVKLGVGLVAVYGTLFGLGGALLRGPAWGALAITGLACAGWLLFGHRSTKYNNL